MTSTNHIRSIRPFIGSKNYQQSIGFYQQLGFEVLNVGEKLSYVRMNEKIGFYLQDAYVKKWVHNTMLFFEVDDVGAWHQKVKELDLVNQYKVVRCSEIVYEDWGKEFFLHDPEGILLHIGNFK